MGLIDATYLHRMDGMRLSDLCRTCLFLLSVPGPVAVPRRIDFDPSCCIAQ
jgi:hypothetical protein